MKTSLCVKVSKVWLEELVQYQSGKELKLAPKLTQSHLDPSQYEKMSVKLAAQVGCLNGFVLFQQLQIEQIVYCETKRRYLTQNRIHDCRFLPESVI